MENWEIRDLISFENRNKNWFPAIDSRFKFDMIIVSSEKTGNPFKARFYVNNEDEIEEAFDYPIQMIKKLSPKVLGVTEFRSEKDIEVVDKIRGSHKLLDEMEFVIGVEFQTTSDNDLFNTSGLGLPVMKGENIHQFNPKFSTNTLYWIEETIGRKRLLEKEINRIERIATDHGKSLELKANDLSKYVKQIVETATEKFEKREFLLDYEVPRLAYRVIARSTDERTLISAVVPERCFLIHSLNYFKPLKYEFYDTYLRQITVPLDNVYFLMALMNSFVLDYYIRLRVSANITMFFIYELPIPDTSDQFKERIISLAKNLMNDPSNRQKRAELEILIARELFKLSKEDMEHIMGTFVYGKVDEELVDMIIKRFEEL